MVVAEAAGEAEEQEGTPLVGKSGHQLFQQLQRIDVQREGMVIHNVLSCRPPNNKLLGQPYTADAIRCCEPNLDASIVAARAQALEHGKTFVIVTLGNFAFKRVMGFEDKKDRDLLKQDFYGYPFRSDKYDAWVYNAPHPAFLVRGNTHLWPVVQFVFKRAHEVARDGLILDECDYDMDTPASVFSQWVDGYLRSLVDDPSNPLSYDIETPYKKKKSDEDEIGKDDEGDHSIIRCSFCYLHNGKYYTSSVKWSAEYMADIERIFALAPIALGWNSDKYDYPRVTRYCPINGISLDAMVAWHFLNSSLPKSLGFVTPYYWQRTLLWKHLSDDAPAFYNAKDAHAALINWYGIKQDLINNRLWEVFERHWIQLSKALKYMSAKGVLRDDEARNAAEAQLTASLVDIESKMEAAVPKEARKFKVLKKAPKDTSGWEPRVENVPVKYCGVCGLHKPTKVHAKHCPDWTTVLLDEPQTVWAKPLEFKVSKTGLLGYQQALSHQAIRDRKEKKITFNADAITMLVKKYPKDKLYPLILDQRQLTKMLGTYIGYMVNGRQEGGMPVGPDGRIHTVYGRNANTLRFTSEDPNLQNLTRPNPSNPDDIVNLIRNLIIASPGHTLYARDYSGIEAVLTGYFAMDPGYIRLARQDIHTYYTVYALYELEGGARVKSCDLPEIGWPDDRLFPYLAELKKIYKKERNELYKHLVHAANFMQGAGGAADKIYSETGIRYPTSTVKKVMDVYYTLFPSIPRYHKNTLDEAEKDGYLRNPHGYVCRFNRAYDYSKEFGEWVKKPGADANRIVAYKPQSTAVGIITEAILKLYFDLFDEVGQYLRLQVHDELLFESPTHKVDYVDQVVREVMEAPIQQMRVPASWNMGEFLTVLTEAKQGVRWGTMR
jgi:uracil-DNA glycosylase family 4